MSDKKICAECGEEFESDRKNGRFCSEKCRRRYNTAGGFREVRCPWCQGRVVVRV